LRARSARFPADRCSRRVRGRSGIIAVRSPQLSSGRFDDNGIGRSPVDTASDGNNNALPGVVT
jgi:hypothetical protein